MDYDYDDLWEAFMSLDDIWNGFESSTTDCELDKATNDDDGLVATMDDEERSTADG